MIYIENISSFDVLVSIWLELIFAREEKWRSNVKPIRAGRLFFEPEQTLLPRELPQGSAKTKRALKGLNYTSMGSESTRYAMRVEGIRHPASPSTLNLPQPI
jgi:hypothetical protein